jgi:3-dehydroquinate dehydratase type I
MRMLAVAFGPRTMAEAVAGLSRVRAEADCVELRLDFFEQKFELDVLLRERGDLPVVMTLRPPDQGGRSTLEPDERLEVLLGAASLGADFVDLEWDVATASAIADAHAAGARVIVSRHDFSSMPADLAADWWPRLAELGADVVKVVGTARTATDGLQVFRAFERATRATIAIAMGEAGLATRVLALRSDHCLLTYAALGEGIGTAPGQITLDEMRQTYRADRVGGHTRVFGLLGPHLERERLADYNAWFSEDAVDAVAVPFIASDSAAATVSAYRELPVSGWHIHGADLQRDALTSLDELAPSAARQARANAVARRATDGALVGHWVESPREQYAVWRAAAGADPNLKR